MLREPLREIGGEQGHVVGVRSLLNRVDDEGHRVNESLDPLLELAARDEREGLGDAPWPPHFRKQKGEPPRVQPSRARGAGKGQA